MRPASQIAPTQLTIRITRLAITWITGTFAIAIRIGMMIGDENGSSPCPDGQPSADRHWTLQPAATANASGTNTPSPKISADLGEDEDSPWLRACLTDKSYPLADPASDGSKK